MKKKPATKVMEAEPLKSETSRTIIVHQEPIGSFGTQIFSGYNSEDYLAQMRGTDRADLFDKMRRGDSQIEMCLMATKSPLLGATWEIEPGRVGDDEPTDEAKEDAELINHILFNDMEETWEDKLEEILSMIDFGHSIFEVTHKAVIKHRMFGAYNGVASLGYRGQRTIHKWNVDKGNGRLLSVSQYAYGDLQRYVDIPAEFLMVFNVKKEGANYEGRSFLRHCYGPYFRKNHYHKLNAAGIEGFAIPRPIASIPEGKQDSPEYTRLVAVLEAYTAHHKNYIIKPEGWEIDLNSNTYDPQKVEVSIDNEDKRIAKGFLANFLELGMNGFGSQSLSVDLSDFFLGGLGYIAHKVAAPFNRQLIPSIINMNRGPRDVYPKLKHSGITDRAGKELAEVMSMLIQNKVITPDDKLESNTRKRYGLPMMSMEGREGRQGSANPAANQNLSLKERVRLVSRRK